MAFVLGLAAGAVFSFGAAAYLLMLCIREQATTAYWKGESERNREKWIGSSKEHTAALIANHRQAEECLCVMAERDEWKAKFTALYDETGTAGSRLFELRMKYKPLPPEGPEDA